MSSNRCGFCGDRGHNRRNCPSLKKKIREEPNGYYARQAKINENQVKNNPRRCGYCRTTGHNKKTCSKRNEDLNTATEKIYEWRKRFLVRCDEVGFGYGALLKFRDLSDFSEWEQHRIERSQNDLGHYGVVVGFAERRLDHRQLNKPGGVVRVRFPSGTTRGVSLPSEFADLIDTNYHTPEMEIAGKVDGSKLSNSFDHQWHNGTDSSSDHVRD